MIPIISESQLRAVMGPADAVAVIRDAFRADGLHETTVPAPINLAVPGTAGEFHVKTAHVAGVPHVAVKIASGFYDNAARGLPTGAGLMALFDASTGMPVALLMDNGYLTDIRTGAAGAVAAECLARDDIEVVSIIGSGVQARQQVCCLREVRRFDSILAWSLDPSGLDRFCGEMRERLGVDARPAPSAEVAVRSADILVTATPSAAPIVLVGWLHPGLHVTAVGSDGPGKQELEAACLARADLLVADRVSQCARLGELQHALAAGLLTEGRVWAELGEVVAGKRPGRTADDQVTIADLTGVGFQDTAIASAAYQRVVNQGV